MQRIADNSRRREVRHERNILRRKLRFAHVRFVLPSKTCERVETRDGFQPDFILSPSARFHQVCCNAPQTIARAFGLASILIEYPQAEDIARSVPQNQSIGANAEMAVADPQS